MTEGHEVYISQIDEGSFIAVSIDSPRFCVGAATEKEASAKAQEALTYFDTVKRVRQMPPRSV